MGRLADRPRPVGDDLGRVLGGGRRARRGRHGGARQPSVGADAGPARSRRAELDRAPASGRRRRLHRHAGRVPRRGGSLDVVVVAASVWRRLDRCRGDRDQPARHPRRPRDGGLPTRRDRAQRHYARAAGEPAAAGGGARHRRGRDLRHRSRRRLRARQPACPGARWCRRAGGAPRCGRVLRGPCDAVRRRGRRALPALGDRARDGHRRGRHWVVRRRHRHHRSRARAGREAGAADRARARAADGLARAARRRHRARLQQPARRDPQLHRLRRRDARGRASGGGRRRRDLARDRARRVADAAAARVQPARPSAARAGRRQRDRAGDPAAARPHAR